MRSWALIPLLLITASLASDEAALLSAICSNPADDTARLVYADWLDEHDQPERAEFIRTQVRAARLPYGDSIRTQLETRAEELRKAHQQEWLPTSYLKICTRSLGDDFRWERGFLGEIKVLQGLDKKEVRSALDQLPLVGRLTVEFSGVNGNIDDHIEGLRRLDLLSRTGAIRLGPFGLGEERLLRVIPALRHVRYIDLGPTRLTQNAAQALIDESIAPNLVGLRAQAAEREAVELIVQSGNFSKIQSYSPGNFRDVLAMLANEKQNRLLQLIELDMGLYESLTSLPPHLNEFVRSPAFRRLRSFQIELLNPDGVRELSSLIAEQPHELVSASVTRAVRSNFIDPRLAAQVQQNRERFQCQGYVLLTSEI